VWTENNDRRRYAEQRQELPVQIMHVWNVAERKETVTFPAPVDAHVMALSPDGKQWASLEIEGPPLLTGIPQKPPTIRVILCDTKTGAVAHRSPAISFSPSRLMWSPDGKWMASTEFRDKSNVIHILETQTFKEVATLRGHTHDIHTMCWSGDSTKLVSVSGDTTGLVWDVTAAVRRKGN
ncbi:MAG: hypothetical protein FWD53_11340, partial [Phycisphaerales bacterium]|nr:hypothetical protein [Phycisphaerales bacterium]